MSPAARESYQTAEILTATPQKLRLMLIEGAIRFSLRARGYWKANEPVKATQALIRAQQIVGELIAGLNTESKSDLVKRLAGIYAFIYRSLLEASFRKDEGRLAAAIRVLEIERETWRQVCEKLGGSTQTRIDQATFHQPQPKMPSFPFAAVDTLHVEQRGGFSLDA